MHGKVRTEDFSWKTIISQSTKQVDGILYRFFLLSCGHSVLKKLDFQSGYKIKCDQC